MDLHQTPTDTRKASNGAGSGGSGVGVGFLPVSLRSRKNGARTEREMSLPILWSHDFGKPIGKIKTEDGRLIGTMNEEVEMSRDMFFEIFGDGVGFRVLEAEERDGKVLIRRFEILEWSLTDKVSASPSD